MEQNANECLQLESKYNRVSEGGQFLKYTTQAQSSPQGHFMTGYQLVRTNKSQTRDM